MFLNTLLCKRNVWNWNFWSEVQCAFFNMRYFQITSEEAVALYTLRSLVFASPPHLSRHKYSQLLIFASLSKRKTVSHFNLYLSGHLYFPVNEFFSPFHFFIDY